MPLKILLIASAYLPSVGGLQLVASGLAAGLLRRGYDVGVITARVPRTLPAREHIGGVPVRRWTFVAPRPGYLRRGRPDLFLAGLAALPLTLARLLRCLAVERPDVVNLHFVGAPALFVLLAHRLRPFPLVVSLHGDDVEGLPYRSVLDRAIFRALLPRADLVTACSGYLARQAALLAPAIAGRTRVIYNGVMPVVAGHAPTIDNSVTPPISAGSAPTPVLSPATMPSYAPTTSSSSETKPSFAPTPAATPSPAPGAGLFAAGRLVPKKGFDVLLRALALCADQTLRLTLSGDGPERDPLCALAHELRVAERVVITRARPHAELMHAMARSSIVVVPSRLEPFGLVALEALQAGRPVVASAAGGLPEVLAGADALLVPPGDPAALAAAIDQASARLASQPEFGVRNRALAARFSLDRMVDAYAQAYAGVLGLPISMGGEDDSKAC